MIVLSIFVLLDWEQFLQFTSPSPYKYIKYINKTNQMTANVQVISIIILFWYLTEENRGGKKGGKTHKLGWDNITVGDN